MPNTIDFFRSLSCLITNDQLMLLGSHYHRFLWHHIFLPFFQSFYLLFLLRLKRFQTLLLWFESPPESILCPYFQLHTFKSHSAYLLQDTWFFPPDFKSSLLLYNYIAKLPFFFFVKYIDNFVCEIFKGPECEKNFNFLLRKLW